MLSILGVSGRIGRGMWWGVQLSTFAMSMIVSYFFDPDSLSDPALVEKIQGNPEYLKSILSDYAAAAPVLLLSTVVSHWLFITSSVQRLHDRNSGGWRVIFAYVPLFVLIGSIFFIFTEGGWVTFLIVAAIGLIGVFVSFLWMIIECGFLSGDDHENDYGDPPGAERRRNNLAEEMRQLRGDTGSVDTSLRPQQAAAQPAMAFASAPVRSSFGKR
jgi:uncharacterized membrane protein YhaH (DUF805 family)